MKMLKKVFIVLALVFLLVTLTSCGRSTTQTVIDQVKTDLAVGTNYGAVQQYFEEHNIEHSWVENEHKFYAIIRNTSSTLLVNGSVQIVVHMNEGNKIQLTEAKEVFTGP